MLKGSLGKIIPIEKRFLSHVERAQNGCMLWTGCKVRAYGQFNIGRPSYRAVLAHRWYYEFSFGPIPEGKVLDHLCRTPACVNPDHLEVVSQKTNVQRGLVANKTHCPKGHPYDVFNTYISPKGDRRCKECGRVREMLRRSKKQMMDAVAFNRPI